MTASPPPPAVSRESSQASSQISGGTSSRGRAAVAVMLILSLIASGLTRQWAMESRIDPLMAGQGAAAGAAPGLSLNALPSFATALLLGGLRGPLVMVLWPMTEQKKQERNLQDLDTEIEWIRLLQPEFDTVHLFQIWNKAFNLSVQMSSLANKYTTILDGLDYGLKVERERPDDINIIFTLGQVFDTKLGTSNEHAYYCGRVRRETQTLLRLTMPETRVDEFRAAASKLGWIEDESPISHNEKTHTDAVYLENALYKQLAGVFSGPDIVAAPDVRQQGRQEDPTWQRVRLDPVVDINGNIFPEQLQPRYPRPADLPADQPWYDGSQLQFLAQFQPYPYGVSALALSYNEAKRAQLLLTQRHQHPIQAGSTDTVVDSRPGIALEHWIADEWERGRRAELRMVRRREDVRLLADANIDPTRFELPAGTIHLTDAIVDPADRDEALYSYTLAVRLCGESRQELLGHMQLFPQYAQVYFSHIDDLNGEEQLFLADIDYLRAMGASGASLTQLTESAAGHYDRAAYLFALNILKYFVDDAIVARVYPTNAASGQQYNRTTIEAADPQTVLATLAAVQKANKAQFVDPQTRQYSVALDQHADSRGKYETYLMHCAARLSNLRAEPATKPAKQ